MEPHVPVLLTGFKTAGGKWLQSSSSSKRAKFLDQDYPEIGWDSPIARFPSYKTLKESLQHRIELKDFETHSPIAELFVLSLPSTPRECLDYKLSKHLDFLTAQHLLASHLNAKVSVAWTRIHYCQIVYKLACYCRILYKNGLRMDVSRLCSATLLMQQLKYRYLKTTRGFRSILQKIVERDESSRLWITVFIADMAMTDKNLLHLVISDGWYSLRLVFYPESIPFVLKLVEKGRMHVGQKIHISGATLNSPSLEGTDITDADCTLGNESRVSLAVGVNQIKRAKWNDGLGLRCLGSFYTAVSCIKPFGGLIPLIRVVLAGTYPGGYYVRKEYKPNDDSRQSIGLSEQEFELFVQLILNMDCGELAQWVSTTTSQYRFVLSRDMLGTKRLWVVLRMWGLTSDCEIPSPATVLALSNTKPGNIRNWTNSVVYLDTTRETTIVHKTMAGARCPDVFISDYGVFRPLDQPFSHVVGIVVAKSLVEKTCSDQTSMVYPSLSSQSFVHERIFLGSPFSPDWLVVVHSRTRQFVVHYQAKTSRHFRSVLGAAKPMEHCIVACQGLVEQATDHHHNCRVFDAREHSTIKRYPIGDQRSFSNGAFGQTFVDMCAAYKETMMDQWKSRIDAWV